MAAFKYKRFYVEGQGIVGSVSPDTKWLQGANADLQDLTYDNSGYRLQAGFMLIPTKLELAGRWAQVDRKAEAKFYDSPDVKEEIEIVEYRAGINWYFSKHDWKWQFDIGKVEHHEKPQRHEAGGPRPRGEPQQGDPGQHPERHGGPDPDPVPVLMPASHVRTSQVKEKVKRMKKTEFGRLAVARALGLGLVLALAAGAAPALRAESITVKGSDTIVIMAQRWAEEYMKKNPGVKIQVTGGGSGTGIAALINGTTDFANSSRKVKSEEKASIEAAKRKVYEFPVALDALSVVVNRENPVTTLSLVQIGKIYSGYINNWKQVGGPDQKIIRYSRESNSGTYSFVKDEVLKGRDYAADCQTMNGTSDVAEAVARDKWGIGYGGVAYFAKVPALRIVSIKKTDDAPAVSPLGADGRPDFKVIYSHDYGLYRYLYMYATEEPKGAKKAYLDWILGPEGQKIVEDVEYVPLPHAK